MGYAVKHLYGVDVTHGFSRLDADVREFLVENESVICVYDRDITFVGAKVPVTRDGAVVTDAVVATALEAWGDLPPGIADAIIRTMTDVCRDNPRLIHKDDREAWDSARKPEPRYHAVAYWG